MRDLSAYLLIALVLLLLGGAAWLTRHPESPVLEPLEGWRVVGGWVATFREAYRPLSGEDGAARPEHDVVSLAPQAFEVRGADPMIWVLSGTEILERPEDGASVVRRLDAITNFQRVEQDGDWFKVWRQDVEGWVHLPGYADDDGEPPLGSEPEPPLPLPARAPDPTELAKARELLGGAELVAMLGPHPLYTDLEPGPELEALDRLAAATEPTYRRRYGLEPVGKPRAALVLFRGEGGYRLLQARSRRLFGLTSSGHTAYGLAVLFRGDRGFEEVAATLVHELVHLLNRRALGPALPPWLDEGLADDLAFGALPEGVLDPSRLQGFRTELGPERDRLHYSGAWGSLWNVHGAHRSGRLPRLTDLLEMSWEEFVTTQGTELRYDAASLFVHYLLEGAQGARREGFRAFLAGVARGEAADEERLFAHLGESRAPVEAEWRAWIEFQARELEKAATRTVTIFE